MLHQLDKARLFTDKVSQVSEKTYFLYLLTLVIFSIRKYSGIILHLYPRFHATAAGAKSIYYR